jgi:hypothetical protein
MQTKWFIHILSLNVSACDKTPAPSQKKTPAVAAGVR